MVAPPQQICRLLDWDTQFFGIRIAQISSTALTDDLIESAVEWCRTEQISCLYYLASSSDIKSIRLAEKFDFHLVDVRLTFEKDLKSLSVNAESPQIRVAQESDIPSLREIARSAYPNTRFFNDGNFTKQMCENLYMTWIEKSCKGYAETVLVASCEHEIAGFITCHLDNGSGRIGLLGVHPNFQNQGWGSRLVKSALEWFRNHNSLSIRVVTQGSNQMAQNLYEHNGFTLASVDLWYHRWFESAQEKV